MIKKALLGFIGIVAVLLVVFVLKFGSTISNFISFKSIEGGKGITYFMGYGGNSGLIIGDNAALLIDTKMGAGAKKLAKIVKSKIGNKKLYVVNTHLHSDHTSGNKLYKEHAILAGNYEEAFWLTENNKNSLPTEWVEREKTIDLGNIQVVLIPIGANHTKNDLFIYSIDHKVLFTGDVYIHHGNPVIKSDSDPNVSGWLHLLREFASNKMEVDVVVPGHGALAKKADLLLLAEYFEDFRTLSRKELKSKYKTWDVLPFLATINKTWKYFHEYHLRS